MAQSIPSIVLVLLAFASQTAATPPATRVLILHQKAIGGPIPASFEDAFIEVMESADSAQIELYDESFEISRFPGPEQFRLVRDFMKTKYADRKIDVVVTLGPEPLALAREAREILGNPPIVALLASTGQLDTNDNVTGLQAGSFIDGTIDLALALLPDTQSVLVVDGSLDDNGDVQADVERPSAARSRPVRLVYLRDLPLTDVVSRVADAPEHSVVLFTNQYMRTRSENVSPLEAFAQVVSASRVPVFSHNEAFVGRGIVGGDVWNAESDGRRMAEIARRIANGTKARDIPPGRATYRTMVDSRQLQRWNIPESRVPAGSVVLFRPPSFFAQYRRYVIGGLIVFAAQLALIGGLIVQGARRRQTEERLRQSDTRYRLATSSALVGVWDWNLETNEIYLDPQLKRFLGYEEHEIANHLDDWGQRVHPDDREAVDMFAQMHISGALPIFEIEHRMLHKDGSIRWFLARGAVVNRNGGKPVRMLGTDTDVTKHKQDERALRESEARAHHLAGKLISAQEAERTRIARELHDDASQRIAALSIGLGIAKRDLDRDPQALRAELTRLQEHAMALGDQIRHFSHELHPGVLQRAGLIAALREHCAEFSEQYRVYVDFRAREVDTVSTDAALCLYRIAQETLHNIGKHAHATRVEVDLKRTAGALELTISDDGRGFDPARVQAEGGLGLISLDERVRLLKGSLTVETHLDRGTVVRARLPEEGGEYGPHEAAPR